MLHLVLATLLCSFNWKLGNDVRGKDVDMTEKLGITLKNAKPLLAVPVAKRSIDHEVFWSEPEFVVLASTKRDKMSNTFKAPLPLRQNTSTGPPSMAYLAAVAVLISVTAFTADAAYFNHTVGGNAGWLFNVNTSTTAANYSDWAAKVTFGLGDYLIFNTNTNQTVVHTYNATTYANCTADFAEDDDTFVYDSGTSDFSRPLTLAVPLTIEGDNYFFSDAGDGFDCLHGMRFEVNVVVGSGLPANLNHPPPPPYTPGPAYEPPPVFLGGGGGQGQELNGCGLQMDSGVFAVAAVAAVLGLVFLL